MYRVAWRNLMHEKIRLAISVGGIALALVLILVMAGVFAGSEAHAVTYIEKQPASLWLMQSGVANLHMSSSLLPAGAVERAGSVPGVADAVGLLYIGGGIDMGPDTVYSYIFAVDNDAPFGGPWQMAAGSARPEWDEVIIDRNLASRYDLGLGDTVSIFGSQLVIAGLSEETFGIATSIAFVNKEALATLMEVSPAAASYILVQPDASVDEAALRQALTDAIPEANVMTRDAFVASDKEMIRQMGADIIQAMSGVAYVVGLLVIGLTIYTATVERSREYGVLKAIGADTQTLMQIVTAQAVVSAAIGYVSGVVLAYLIAIVVRELLPEMLILIEPELWLRQIPVFALTTILAALLPLGKISRLDPLIVFQS